MCETFEPAVLMVHQDLFFLFSFPHFLVIPILLNKSMGYHKIPFCQLLLGSNVNN